MTKKKRFGISDALTRGLSETINVVENNTGLFRNAVIPLSRIELDPDNPRKMAITLEEVKSGLLVESKDDVLKQEELARLQELSHTIKQNGLINPIVVYKRGEVYRIVAGERRCLASILAGKQEIDARVFNEKPKGFELKLVQWVENTAREDLTLDERLGNVRDIIHEYQYQHGVTDITATLLKNIMGLSLSQSTYYLAALQAPEDVQIEIKKGTIRNLDKAALLSNVALPDIRRQAIAACINGANLKELRNIINQEKALKRNKVALLASLKQGQGRGRSTAKINMGTTLKADVIKTIIESVVNQKQFDSYLALFSEIDWMDLRQVTKAFRQLISILEEEAVT